MVHSLFSHSLMLSHDALYCEKIVYNVATIVVMSISSDYEHIKCRGV